MAFRRAYAVLIAGAFCSILSLYSFIRCVFLSREFLQPIHYVLLSAQLICGLAFCVACLDALARAVRALFLPGGARRR